MSPALGTAESARRGHRDPDIEVLAPAREVQNYETAKAARSRVLALVEDGSTVKDALAAVNRSESTYSMWRRRWKDWAAMVDAARYGRAALLGYRSGFVGFRSRYLGHPSTWFQIRAADVLESAEQGSITLILWPPEHGKTTTLEDFCTYKLSLDPTHRITVGSGRLDHSKKVLRRVRRRFEPGGPSAELLHRFGPFAPPDSQHYHQPWGSEFFNVFKKGDSDERDYSMAAVGLGTGVQGTRADTLILDDLQSLKTLALTDQIYDTVVQDFISRPGVHGRTVILGTRVGEWDIYRRMIDEGIVDHLIQFPAYNITRSPPWPAPRSKEEAENPPEEMEWLWPGRYSPRDYGRLRWRVKERAWARNYMQHPEGASQMTFSDQVTDLLKDHQRSVLADPHRPLESSRTKVVIAVDPSIGGRNATSAAALQPDRCEILDARVDHGLVNNAQVIQVIAEYASRYTGPDHYVDEVVIEDKAFQRGLLNDDDLIALQRLYGFRIVPNTTGTEKADPDIGIPGMPTSIRRGELTIPWADPASEAAMAELLDDLHIWRPGVRGNKLRQDLTMTTWFLWRRWRAHRELRWHERPHTDQFRTRHSPMRTRGRR